MEVWFWEPVTTQQCDSFVVVIANAAASAFICTFTGMQEAALGMWDTVMASVRVLPFGCRRYQHRRP